MQKKYNKFKELKIKIIKKVKRKKQKKEKRLKKKEISIEMQKPKIEADIYNNNKKCY